MKSSQDIGRALFAVEPMPMGALAIPTPSGCAVVRDEVPVPVRGEGRNCYACFWRQKEVVPKRRLVCGKDDKKIQPSDWCESFKPRERSPKGCAQIWAEK